MKDNRKGERIVKKANSERDSEFAEVDDISTTEYSRLKRKAIRFEAINRRFLLLVPCSGGKGWCEMSERSALMYKYLVCEKLGASVSLMDDFDSFYNQYKIGRIRTRGYDLVRLRVKNAGYYKDEVFKDHCLVIELKRGLTEEQLKKLEQEELERQEGLNEIVKTQPIDPVLYQKLLEVATRIHRLCLRNLDRISGDTTGHRLVELADKMMLEYHMFSDEISKMSDDEITARWTAMKNNAHMMLNELQIIAGLKLWKREVCVSVGEGVVILEDRIGQRLARHLLNVEKRQEEKKREEKKNGVKTKATTTTSRFESRSGNSAPDRDSEVAAEQTGSGV